MKNPVAIINAARKGMGAAIARELSAAGYFTGQNLRVEGGLIRSA
jgi:NAD(P)-dependent dehydrogenase (short-subunit alcohol dehydrogenase family)